VLVDRIAPFFWVYSINPKDQTMQFHPNQLFLLYNPQTSVGKQTIAMAQTVSNHINEVDAVHEKLGPMYWKEIITLLGMDPEELLDHSHPDYREKVGADTYTMNGWIEVIMHYPQLLKAPIAIFNGKAVFCQNPYEILKLQQASNGANKVPPHLKPRE